MSGRRVDVDGRDTHGMSGNGGDLIHDALADRHDKNGALSSAGAARSMSPMPRIKAEAEAEETASSLRPAPLPSAKRRESFVNGNESENQSALRGKKRKRAVSPPWTFPTAEKSTIKTTDGRRVSARHARTSTPGHPLSSGSELTPLPSEGEGAARNGSILIREGSFSSGQDSKSRAPSPPWKRVQAEGPTTIMQNGVRKSGRQNRELLHAPKRISPRSKRIAEKQKLEVESIAVMHKKERKEHKGQSTAANEASKLTKIEELQAKLNALQPSRSVGTPATPAQNGVPAAKATHKQKYGEAAASEPTAAVKRQYRTSIGAASTGDLASTRPVPRIKLRFSNTRPFINPPHPGAVFPSPARPPQPSLYQIIESYEIRELQDPTLEYERGIPDMDHFITRSLRQAQNEGALRNRILRAAEPGGPLSKEACSLYRETEVIEPSRQYAHADHLAGHISWLRYLQRREKDQHKQLAKKLAFEALERYKQRRGPTEEDIQAEKDRIYVAIYRQTVADMKGKWELVQRHVENLRLQRWEAAEEIKRQARLQEQLAWSEEQVKRQRGEVEEYSDALDSDENGELEDDRSHASSGASGMETESQSDSEVMSETEEDDESPADDDGEALDQEELDAYKKMRAAQPPDMQSSDQGSDRENYEGEDENEDENEDEDEYEDDKSADDGIAAMLTNPRHAARKSVSDERPLLFDHSTAELDSSIGDNSPLPQESVHYNQQEGERVRAANHYSSGDETGGGNLSDDESTDMDSEDYDSDENGSTSDDEGEGSEDDSGESGSDLEHGGLLALFSKKEKEAFGLPTPVASAEDGDGEDRHAERDTSASANAAVESIIEEDQQKQRAQGRDDPNSDIELVEGGPDSPPASHSDHDESTDVIRELIPPPSLLRGVLRSYQHAGLDWLASLYRNGTNGILADEMGLGKTIQTIALLAHLAEAHDVWETHLVIVPTSVILNWVTEFQKFLPGFRVLGYYGNADERQRLRRGWVNDPHHEIKEKRGYNVVVTSYQVAMSDINSIRTVQWHYLVLDEAHNIRNFMSQRWQTLIRLKTRARLMLTGTPLQNSLTELWSLLTFLTAGDDIVGEARHGSLEEFLSHWKEPVKEIFDRGVNTLSSEAQRVVEKLHLSLRPFLLRRLKSEVEKDLPKKTESVVVCKLSKRQRQLYQDYMGLADTKAKLAQGNAVTAGKVLLSLRRVCNHPDLFDPRPIQTSYELESSPIEPYAASERLIRHLLGEKIALPDTVRLVAREELRKRDVKRERQLIATSLLRRQADDMEEELKQQKSDLSSISGCRQEERLQQRQKQLHRLCESIQFGERCTERMPIFGADLRELVSAHKFRDDKDRPVLGKTTLRLITQPAEKHVSDRILVKTAGLLQQQVPTLNYRAELLNDTIARFAFVTPRVTAPILDLVLPERMQEQLRASGLYPAEFDFAQEARVRTSIAFPDKRLLIYDSGKLQRLTVLLRELQSKGSRSLIFTQMTGTLNILEQFLNLLGLPYLRLDGSTPVERRQLYSTEFNRPDSKYQCMILSSRAGGVGLNLVGASSVIFFDLDWNPQMDRQCMDRAHRIGQVRDVEVYKMVSEKTVEENILRRANQKSLLDQTVIQEGHFTTEHHFERRRANRTEEIDDADADMEAALERAIGGGEKALMQTMEAVEDKEDVQAALRARKEEHQDDLDFADRSSKGPSVPPTPHGEHDLEEVEGERQGHIDRYLIRQMERLMKDVPFIPPRKEKRIDKNRRGGIQRATKKK